MTFPSWCKKVAGEHAMHVRNVLLDVVAVTISAVEGLPNLVTLINLEGGSSMDFTPEQARTLGQVLAVRDPGLSRALIEAAGLVEGGQA